MKNDRQQNLLELAKCFDRNGKWWTWRLCRQVFCFNLRWKVPLQRQQSNSKHFHHPGIEWIESAIVWVPSWAIFVCYRTFALSWQKNLPNVGGILSSGPASFYQCRSRDVVLTPKHDLDYGWLWSYWCQIDLSDVNMLAMCETTSYHRIRDQPQLIGSWVADNAMTVSFFSRLVQRHTWHGATT